MKRAYRYVIYAACFFLLMWAEKQLGIRPFAVGFLMALFFCRENVLIILPVYVCVSMLTFFSVENLYFCLTPCAVILLASFFHFRTQRKLSIFLVGVYAFLSQIPVIVFGIGDVYQLTNTIISVVGTQTFTYLSIVMLYPILVRKLKYRLKPFECVAAGAFVACLSIGLALIDIAGFPLFYVVALFAVLIAQACFKKGLFVAVILGVGGGLSLGDPMLCVRCTAFGLVCLAFGDVSCYFLPAASLVAYLALNYLMNAGFSLLEFLSIVVGCVAFCCVPPSIRERIRLIKPDFAENYASRTLVNRDRNDMSLRLRGLARIFYDMQDVLKNDLRSREKKNREELLVREVCGRCCFGCGGKELCDRAFSGNIEIGVSYIIRRGIQTGKINMLDVPNTLADCCRRLNTLVTVANEALLRYKSNLLAKENTDVGKEMVGAQMGGMGILLDKLAEELSQELAYDTEREKTLLDRLSYADIFAYDAVIYGTKKVRSLTLVLNAGDADKPELIQIISDCLKMKMEEQRRENNIKGTQTLYFSPAAKYGLAYGEALVGKDGTVCGDSKLIAKVAPAKLILVLSDGMGSGEGANENSGNAVVMLEGFYRAGFDHTTILNCMGKLLSVRGYEDYNALDVAVVDLTTGATDFIKQGGRESFVLHPDKSVELIECGSLPLGVLEEALPVIERRQLSTNDLIILISDGVIDALGRDMLLELLAHSTTLNPAVLAELIVNNAKSVLPGADDCSCLIGRLVLK